MAYTQRELEKMECGDYWDPTTHGLVLRVTKAGSKTWFFVYRVGGRAAKKKWLKLSAFEAMPLNRARLQVNEHRVKVGKGIDPAQAIKDAETIGITISDLAEKFRAEYLPKRTPSTRAGYEAALDKYIIPAIGKHEAATITRDQVGVWHRGIDLPIAANRALAVLSCMMTQAIEVWGIRDTSNPCLRVERNPENPRLRDITKAELKAIGDACRTLAGQHSVYALAAVRVALLCWGRVSEVLGLRRDRDVYLSEGFALIRDHKGKKSGAKRLELPPHAIKILKSLPEEKGNPFYFPGRLKGQSITRNGLHKTWLSVCAEAKVKDLHLHDSRSLAASEAEAQGINPKSASAILGHRDTRTTQKHYAKVRNSRSAAAAVSAPIAEALGE